MSVNHSNLTTILQAALEHSNQLDGKSPVHQSEVDAITEAANQLDTRIVQVVQAPDPGPRTDLDFSALQDALAVFMSNSHITQESIAGIITLLKNNTPQ